VQNSPLHHLPIVTTILSAVFCPILVPILVRAALVRQSGPHLWWWAFGVFCYGLGTLLESAITLTGNTVELTKAWYIAGALLGGYPLAQGSVYLLAKRKTANLLTAITVPFIVIASVLVLMSPVFIELLDPLRPSGKILAWTWVRLLTPFINVYAFIFLVGGAIVSARRYAKIPDQRHRYIGNLWIAVGAILPGIGGAVAKTGGVETLYVLELLGLMLMWKGYTTIAGRNEALNRHDHPQIQTSRIAGV
jgi:hypothetical protein